MPVPLRAICHWFVGTGSTPKIPIRVGTHQTIEIMADQSTVYQYNWGPHVIEGGQTATYCWQYADSNNAYLPTVSLDPSLTAQVVIQEQGWISNSEYNGLWFTVTNMGTSEVTCTVLVTEFVPAGGSPCNGPSGPTSI